MAPGKSVSVRRAFHQVLRAKLQVVTWHGALRVGGSPGDASARSLMNHGCPDLAVGPIDAVVVEFLERILFLGI